MEIMIIMACVILTAGVLWLMGYQRFKQKKKKDLRLQLMWGTSL